MTLLNDHLPWLCTLVTPPVLSPRQQSCSSKRISLGYPANFPLSKYGGGGSLKYTTTVSLISAEKRIVLVFFALYYKLKQLRPPRYRFCKVYFCPNKCRKAHSSRACNFILRNKQATTFYILYVTISIFLIFFCSFFIFCWNWR